MIIVKFALILFMATVALMVVLRPGQGVPVGGPIFYMAMPGSHNPIRPSARLNAYAAKKHRHIWRVWFDGSGDPVKWRLYDDKVPVYEETLLWRRPGELLARKRTL